jgi:hypothetical protein
VFELGPVFPQQQTCRDCFGMSERCHEETSNAQVAQTHSACVQRRASTVTGRAPLTSDQIPVHRTLAVLRGIKIRTT